MEKKELPFTHPKLEKDIIYPFQQNKKLSYTPPKKHTQENFQTQGN